MIAIRQVRESVGVSAAELARRLGVSQTMVIRWERADYTPRPATLRRIGDALGLEVDITFAVTFSPPRPR